MRGKLTKKQQKFVEGIVGGCNLTRAAELAGYDTPCSAGWRLSRVPHIQEAIQEATFSTFTGELLSKSLRRLDEILDDLSAAPAGIKLKAAQYVIDKSVELYKMTSLADVSSKNPLDMSEAELEVFIMRGRVVLQQETAKRELGIIDVSPEE